MTQKEHRTLRKLYKLRKKGLIRIEVIPHSDIEGNIWAWCRVEVRATYGGYTASDYLPYASYASRWEFEHSESYDNLRDIVIGLIMEQLEVDNVKL